MVGLSAGSNMNPSNDVAWEYGMCNPSNANQVKCKLCGKEFFGGAYRMKEHIAKIQGNVFGCPKSSKDDQEKCKNAIGEGVKQRIKERRT